MLSYGQFRKKFKFKIIVFDIATSVLKNSAKILNPQKHLISLENEKREKSAFPLNCFRS